MYDGYAPLDFWGPYQILTGVCFYLWILSGRTADRLQAASNFNITLSMIGKEKGIITNVRSIHDTVYLVQIRQ